MFTILMIIFARYIAVTAVRIVIALRLATAQAVTS